MRLRVEHRVGADFTNSPATINGHHLNTVAASASGGTIAGGGVAFAAIQGLNEKLTNELKRVRAELVAKRDETLKLKARLAAIEKKLGL